MQRRGRPNRQPRRGNHQPSNNSAHSNTPNSTPNRPQRPRAEYHSVPAYASIHPGTAVSLVLKVDQPSGHEVQGIVAELLTRGDHPRGVKVRLRDGRVGRVQRLVSEDTGLQGENLVGGADAGLDRDGEAAGRGRGRGGGGGRRGGFAHVKDIREDDEYLYDESKAQESSNSGYFAALELADTRHEENRRWAGVTNDLPEARSQMAVCPVCGEFEGDERAVAHHVEGHFDEGE